MGTLHFIQTSVRSAEAFRRSGACSPWNFYNFTAYQACSEATSLYRQTRVRWAYETHTIVILVYMYISILRHLISWQFSTRFAIDNDTIIRMHTCTGGARPVVARAHAPVCPTRATPLLLLSSFFLSSSFPPQERDRVNTILNCFDCYAHVVLGLVVESGSNFTFVQGGSFLSPAIAAVTTITSLLSLPPFILLFLSSPPPHRRPCCCNSPRWWVCVGWGGGPQDCGNNISQP